MLNDKLFALLMVGISINSFGNVLCFDAFKDYPPRACRQTCLLQITAMHGLK